MNASESSEGFFGLSIGRAVITSHSRCAKDSASCNTKFCRLREHRVMADVLLKNFVAAAVFSVSYFLNVVEEFRRCLSKPQEGVCHFGLSIGRAVMTAVCYIRVNILTLVTFLGFTKLLLFMLLFKHFVFLI